MKYNPTEVSDGIIVYLNKLYGESGTAKYLEFIRKDQNQFIRTNNLKTDTETLRKNLFCNYGIECELVKEIHSALRVISDKNNLLGKTIEHITGDYYIQSLSSMLPPIVLSPASSDVVLDLCSAPGSKTTQLAGLMNNIGTLIANEVQLDRVKTLVYNLDRMNIINTGVIHFKGEWLGRFYQNYFDKILVDAPCSGLGIIQKRGEVSNWWSNKRVENLSELQLKLLVVAVKMLKPGGELVYSTCTMTVEENEMVIDKLINKYPLEILPIEIPIKSNEGFTSFNGNLFNPSLSYARRIIPWEADSEGFFLVKIRKNEITPFPESINIKPNTFEFIHNKKLTKYFQQLEKSFGISPNVFDSYKFLMKSNDLFFVSANWEDNYLDKFSRIGIKLGTIDKNDELNLHTNAAEVLQKEITKNKIIIEDNTELKKYLEGGIIKRESGIRGQVVVGWKDSILGTAIVSDGGIKSRFPRSKRTQDIFIE